jgi:hypothetical protein
MAKKTQEIISFIKRQQNHFELPIFFPKFNLVMKPLNQINYESNLNIVERFGCFTCLFAVDRQRLTPPPSNH